MRVLTIAPVLAALSAAPAAAEVWDYGQDDCNELWFMRNLIMDRAGYCFGSALGQALFDNGDCTGKDVRLATEPAAQVKRIQALETEIGCRVDTARRSLKVRNIAALRRLRDMPLPDNGGWACLSWEGRALPIYDGYSAGSRAIGEIRPGSRVGHGWINVGTWKAVAVSESNSDMIGWIDNDSIDWESACPQMAG